MGYREIIHFLLQESPEQAEGEGEGGVSVGAVAVATEESHCSPNLSGTEWVSPELSRDIRNHQVQWKRRQQDNNRFV